MTVFKSEGDGAIFMKVISLKEIKSRLDLKRAIAMQEEALSFFSQGKVTVPPVGYMKMGEDLGEVHIKYGWIKGDEIFIVKMQELTHTNKAKVQGIILAFDAKTGVPIVVLQDEGYLTNLRTAIAGLIAAKYLAPEKFRVLEL